MRIRPLIAFVLFAGLLSRPAAAQTTFNAGSVIIPMDVNYQDSGMLKAFGLLDQLLRAGITVNWCIITPKTVVDPVNGIFTSDFTAAATDYQSGAVITDTVNGKATGNHAYRGGPFVVDSSLAGSALKIVKTWQAQNTTAVHVATAPFSAIVAKTLTAAPRIAVYGDGNQNIAFGYLNAAGILDEQNKVWGNNSVDLLTPVQVTGPSAQNPQDGALFRASGQPAFCEIMTMHWDVNSAEIPAVTAEMRSFLKYPVHLNAECQAVNSVEGAPPVGGNQKFVAPQGFVWPAPAQPMSVQFSNSQLAFAQMDGPFGTTGGSEPAYQLPQGTAYYDSGIVMVRAAGQPLGVQDIWMTGYAGGGCKIGGAFGCGGGNGAFLGKVSYLGGHMYSTNVPMTKNPMTQGTRLFLNSLYEAGCVDGEGQPVISVNKSGPAFTSNQQVTYTLTVTNGGAGPAINAMMTDQIPVGTTFVGATGSFVNANGLITWTLGDLGAGASTSVTLTLNLSKYGNYTNQAATTFQVGLNTVGVFSNSIVTTYGPPMDMAVPPDLAMIPPDLAIPPDLHMMAQPMDMACGACQQPNNACEKAVCMAGKCVIVDVNNGTACTIDECTTGATCFFGACQGGAAIVCPAPKDACHDTMCDPAKGCGYTTHMDGTPCDDNDACTMNTSCLAGMCSGGMQTTCPRLPCTSAMCDPVNGCSMLNVPMGNDPYGDCTQIGCNSLCNGNASCDPLVCVDMTVPPEVDMSMLPPVQDMSVVLGPDLYVSIVDMAVAAPDLTMMSMQPGMDLALVASGDLAMSSMDQNASDLTGGGPVIDDGVPFDGPNSGSFDLAVGGGGQHLDFGGGNPNNGPDLATGVGGLEGGGCGCKVGARPSDSSTRSSASVLGGLLMMAALVRRRRSPLA